MFVGVGASRVRDLFQTARKQAPAIIFVDEIDSIGRKRGAGLGGGHDEREQTLNQMLSEMDGFDAAEGVVMMAATNRPDILDPALLRPGRFDRQIVVPLPDLDERLPILQVHCRDKRIGPDVDLDHRRPWHPGHERRRPRQPRQRGRAARRAARQPDRSRCATSTPPATGCSWASRRDSLVLSDAEKARVAFHEGGHAVLAYVLPHADPLLKVSIIPTGMALGVTQQLPTRGAPHLPARVHRGLARGAGWAGASPSCSSTATFRPARATTCSATPSSPARWSASGACPTRVGPMAWGSQGMVFLGEDLMHSRDYSEDTSRVVDEEVARILREQEAPGHRRAPSAHRAGLEAVARALLEHETIDGAEIARLDRHRLRQARPPERRERGEGHDRAVRSFALRRRHTPAAPGLPSTGSPRPPSEPLDRP